MQPREYLKIKARKLAKQTWAGPGKFGVFIVICIIVIAFFESLGLSNREKNLELRNVHSVVIPLNYNVEKMNEAVDLIKKEINISSSIEEKIKLSFNIEIDNKNIEREDILLFGAMDQYLFENKESIKNYEKIQNQEQKDKSQTFLTILLKEKEEIINSIGEDTFLFDI